jgi:hypothetical protein
LGREDTPKGVIEETAYCGGVKMRKINPDAIKDRVIVTPGTRIGFLKVIFTGVSLMILGYVLFYVSSDSFDVLVESFFKCSR